MTLSIGFAFSVILEALIFEFSLAAVREYAKTALISRF
jgi:hypothetical protein